MFGYTEDLGYDGMNAALAVETNTIKEVTNLYAMVDFECVRSIKVIASQKESAAVYLDFE
jgi:hypothetical protein